jgi:putative endonuclease
MRDGDSIVFVEVRYRRSARFGGGLESITDRKRSRLIRTAAHFLVNRSGPSEPPCRFDVIAISGGRENYAIDWIADAFSA